MVIGEELKAWGIGSGVCGFPLMGGLASLFEWDNTGMLGDVGLDLSGLVSGLPSCGQIGECEMLNSKQVQRLSSKRANYLVR